jgi:hypothetical protein
MSPSSPRRAENPHITRHPTTANPYHTNKEFLNSYCFITTCSSFTQLTLKQFKIGIYTLHPEIYV